MKEKFYSFTWDLFKENINIAKHAVDFSLAARAFRDPDRKIYIDEKHNQNEERFFCFGKVNGRVLTVRFIYREEKIRIIGAGYWRKGKNYYDKEDNKL